MRTDTNNFSGPLLTGTLVLAGFDVSGLVEYGLKAIVGGAVWLAFKIAADLLERRKRKSADQ